MRNQISTKNIIIVRVLGGLGNQLFIYAFARYLSLELPCSVFLETRTGFLRDSYERVYRLNKYNIKLKTCPWYYAIFYPLRKRYSAITKLIFGNITFLNDTEFLKNPELAFKSIRESKKTFLDGYWQYPKYFANYERIIKNELSVKNKINNQNTQMADKMKQCNSIAIHLRRVHYDTLLELVYYKKAILKIKTKIKDPVFYVFSDDIEWCRQNFKTDDIFVFVDHNSCDEIAELWLMSQCKHFIIANSSFSWWGSWLSQNYEKIIIMPEEQILIGDKSF